MRRSTNKQRFGLDTAPILYTGHIVSKPNVANDYYVNAWGPKAMYYLIKIKGKTNPLLVSSAGGSVSLKREQMYIHDQSRAPIGMGRVLKSSKNPRTLINTGQSLRLYTFK